MPVTAKLSRKFYETLGDDVANELVDWFNQVDMAYRSELRELNELNFARFDSRLEQRVAESEARLRQRMTELDARLRQEIAEFRTEVRTDMANLRADMMKWMFLYWVGTALTVIGLLKF